MPHVGFADVGHKKERKGIMLSGNFKYICLTPALSALGIGNIRKFAIPLFFFERRPAQRDDARIQRITQ